MQYALEQFAHEIRTALSATGLIDPEHIELVEPKANIPADVAVPCFRAAKANNTNPAKLATALAEAIVIAPDGLLGGVAAAGPFLNFALPPARFAALVLGDVTHLGDQYGHTTTGDRKTVIVEYSSPNVAKRMHVGHIRSTIIGQALANIMAALGYNVIADNHLGDWGKQFGTNIASIMRFGKPAGEGEAALAAIEQQYQRYNRLLRGDAGVDDNEVDEAAMDDEARRWSLLLEQGDAEARALWQWMREITLVSNQRNYDRLGVRFDTVHGESFYNDMQAAVMQAAQEQGIAIREEGGALSIKGLHDANGRELPSFLLQRSDGGTLYLTRDVATIEYRADTYHPAAVLYVVEQRQELHFRQTFATARALHVVDDDVQLVHVAFGTIFGTNGEPLSTRKGNMVYLETLLDDAEARALSVIQAKIAEGRTELGHEEAQAVARAVGIGAVVYNDLFQDPKRNITLDWEQMLAFEGNSAPYLQYTYARCCAMLRDATGRNEVGALFAHLADWDAALLGEPQSLAVLKQLARFPDTIRRAGEHAAPYVIADWLFATAREFARFYRDLPVLKAPTPELRAARLALVAATAQNLRNGLRLLGITAPERM